jgi:hypothetical protein
MFECDPGQVPLFQTITKLSNSVHARCVYVCMYVYVCVCVIMHHSIKFLLNSATRVLEQDGATLALDKTCNPDACIYYGRTLQLGTF